MARVFLSYDREDAARARVIAQALEKAGHRVWWDQVIRPGAQFGNEIEQALKDSDAVIVLWSEQSIDSAWVRDEAAAGRDRGRLVPVLLDRSQPPLGFRQFQSIDLSRWKGRTRSVQLDKLLDAVASATGGVRPPLVPEAPAPGRRSMRRWIIGPALALILIVAAVAYWSLRDSSPRVPLVAVTAADPSPGTRAWARDLLIKLGGLQTANADALRLVDEGSETRPDLIFEVGGAMQAENTGASLLLRSGKDRAVLWSKDFQQAGTKVGDQKQQLAHTAAQVLGCAVEATGSSKPLEQQLLKVYLSACSALTAVDNLAPLRPTFLEITREAPRFEGGWAKLLKIEARMATLETGVEQTRIHQAMQRHIAQARKVNPHMAQAYLAEAALLPGKALFEQMELLDRAIEHNPENPDALLQRSFGLMTVGRMNDALADARQAAAIDLLSPAARDQCIFVLIVSGLDDLAIEELAKAERLWPGATNLANTRFFFNLHSGDPKEALRTLESQRFEVGAGWATYESFLKARLNPSSDNVERALAKARSVTAAHPTTLTMLLQNLGTFDRHDELFETIMRSPSAATRYVNYVIFRPSFRDFWHNPRSMRAAAHLGLIDYWRRSGKWPDFCSDAPYDCKAEAAKVSRA